MAAALPFIAMGMGAIGSMKSAQSAEAQGAAAASAQRFNAAAAQRNAQVARDQAAQDASAKQIEGINRIGAARAAYGAAGVTSEGSPLDVLAETASLVELDRQTILYKGKLRALGYEDQSTLDLMSADYAGEAGQDKATSVLLGGAGTLGTRLDPVFNKGGNPNASVFKSSFANYQGSGFGADL